MSRAGQPRRGGRLWPGWSAVGPAYQPVIADKRNPWNNEFGKSRPGEANGKLSTLRLFQSMTKGLRSLRPPRPGRAALGATLPRVALRSLPRTCYNRGPLRGLKSCGTDLQSVMSTGTRFASRSPQDSESHCFFGETIPRAVGARRDSRTSMPRAAIRVPS